MMSAQTQPKTRVAAAETLVTLLYLAEYCFGEKISYDSLHPLKIFLKRNYEENAIVGACP